MFNEEMITAFKTGVYICPECYGQMEFETEDEDILVCPNCGYSMDLDHYGFTDEEYADLYPTEDQL